VHQSHQPLGWKITRQAFALFNLVKNNLVFPNEWKICICVPFPEKGDITKMSNYRGITFMSITAKLYDRLLLNSMQDLLKKILRVNQARFSICYVGYLRESEIRTSCLLVPSLVFARPLTATSDRSCSVCFAIAGFQTMFVKKSLFYTLAPSHQFP